MPPSARSSTAAWRSSPRKRHGPRSATRRAGFLAGGATKPLAALSENRWAAFCGLGNPAGFRHTLESCGCRPAASANFPDHHRYARKDIESLARWAEELDATAAVCTHKDLVKVGVEFLGRRPLWALGVGIEFLSGEAEMEIALDRILTEVRHDE